MAHGSLSERIGEVRWRMGRNHVNAVKRMPRERTRRLTDGEVTSPSVRLYKLERGFTLIELLVVVGIFGVLMGIALPRLPQRSYALWIAQQQLLADLRATRADALTKGDHFRFDVSGSGAYAEYRMTLVGNNWVASATPTRSRVLPSGVTFASGVGSSFEFNTRGLMLNPGAAATLALSDALTAHTRAVTVWPSGQVAPQ